MVRAAFDEHAEALFRYVARLTGDSDIAADVVQETFTRLLTRPPRRPGPLKPWIFTVATNLARDDGRERARRRRLTLRHEGRQPVGDAPDDPETAAVRNDLRDRVRSALAELPERDRSVLLLRENGFSHREIARAVGTTEKSVGTLIVRALNKLEVTLHLDREST